MKKKISGLVFMLILLGCSNNHFKNCSEHQISRVNEFLDRENAQTEGYSILVFTHGFDNAKIKISDSEKVIYDTITNVHSLGISKSYRVNNSIFLELKVNDKEIKMNRKLMKKNKFIYIRKEGTVKIEYLNKMCKFF